MTSLPEAAGERRRLGSRLGLGIAVALCALASACSERPLVRYRDYGEAEAAGALSRGWLPRTLPRSAVGILELHDLDSNETWGYFSFSPEAATDIVASMTRIKPEELAGKRLRPPSSVTEWPASITGVLDTEKLREAGFIYYVDSEDRSRTMKLPTLHMAVHAETHRCFFWRQLDFE